MNIPFPASSSPGANRQEGGGRIINAYAKKAPPGAPNPVLWLRPPGLRELIDINTTNHVHCRGFILVGSTLLGVFNTRVWSFTESGGVLSATNLGALSGTDLITVAKNNAATPNIVAVTSGGAFNLFTGSAPTSFADADLPQPNSVASLNGYLLFTIGAGQVWATGLNAVTVATNANITAPGPLIRGVSFRGEFFAFGNDFCKPYRDAGLSPFPLEGAITSVIPRGIIGPQAVAGWEPGWSSILCWVADDCMPVQLDGYSAVPIGTDDVVRDIRDSADPSAIQCSVAMADDIPMLFIKSPGEFTWVRDMKSGEWHERNSYQAEDFRGSCSVKAFDMWLMGDEETGKIAEFDEDYYLEYGDPLIWSLESGVPPTFPSRGNVPRADFHFTAGTGIASGDNPIQTNPKVGIQWSKDGGASYGPPLLRELGQQGRFKNHPFVTRCGMFSGNGVRFKLSVSDPVHVGFMGGAMPVQQLAE